MTQIYLSLFSGVGGGDLAFQHLLKGFRCVGYVEYEKYCQDVLRQRIEDGLLDCAPIFGDIREFNREYAKEYKGMVDLITGGFPCQPFTSAGKQKGEDDPRNMWPETKKSISIIRPNSTLLENVPGIQKYMPTIIRDLRGIGYTVKRPQIVAAASLGAGHIRRRIWIYAYNNKKRWKDPVGKLATEKITKVGTTVGMVDGEKISANINEMRELQPQRSIEKQRKRIGNRNWWTIEPDLERVVYGIPYGMDRVEALGNAQIPIVAATAWEILRGI